MDESVPRAETRDRLIEAGLLLFGQSGFEGTSTRALAQRADTNVASIAYHFGGKQGLFDACLLAVADRLSVAWQGGTDMPPTTPGEAAAALENVLRGLVSVVVGDPQSRVMVDFVLRNVMMPVPRADRFYTVFFEARHQMLCHDWALATGRGAEDDDVRLAVFSMIGQVFYFNLARPLVERRMGWAGYGTQQATQIADTVVANLHAALERHRR